MPNTHIIDYLGKILCCAHLIISKKRKSREQNEKNKFTEKRNEITMVAKNKIKLQYKKLY